MADSYSTICCDRCVQDLLDVGHLVLVTKTFHFENDGDDIFKRCELCDKNYSLNRIYEANIEEQNPQKKQRVS